MIVNPHLTQLAVRPVLGSRINLISSAGSGLLSIIKNQTSMCPSLMLNSGISEGEAFTYRTEDPITYSGASTKPHLGHDRSVFI